jgi:hypothetical protein
MKVAYEDYMTVFEGDIEYLHEAVNEAKQGDSPEDYDHAVRLLIDAVIRGGFYIGRAKARWDRHKPQRFFR